MTARDIIIQAQRKLGVETVQKTPTAKEISDGLEALNSMISSWSADRLLIQGYIYLWVRRGFRINKAYRQVCN